MSKIKSFANYLIGKDILEERKRWNQVSGERSLKNKIFENIDDFFSFGIRYAPLVLEIDGIRRVSNGQYGLAGIELFIAEYIRIGDYANHKIDREYLNFTENNRRIRIETQEEDRRLNEKIVVLNKGFENLANK